MRLISSEAPSEVVTDVIEDGDDFAAWYEATWPRLVRAVAVFMGDLAAAPDIASDAFARAFERWHGDSKPDDPTAWVTTVALNLAKKRWRREVRGHGPLAEDHGSVEPVAIDVDLSRAIAELPRRERESIALRYGFDLTEKDVAGRMGITPGAAAATLHSARTKLRSYLTEDDHG